MKSYKKLWRYGILRRLKRGILLSILPTLRCNYDCEYCTVKMPTGKRKHYDEVELADWLTFIDRFPVRIREVHITGGEPTLKPYFVDLVNALLDRGKCVTVFTNLNAQATAALLRCHRSPRLRIHASYHAGEATKYRFEENYRKLAGYQITVDEIGVRRLSIPSDVKRKITDAEDLKTYDSLRVAPDLTVYPSCFELW